MNIWLADTGPLVAFLASNEQHHAWAVEQLKLAPNVLFSCEAVLTETIFLLERDGFTADPLFALVDSGLLRCNFDFHREYRLVRALMRKYQDRPMSFADACLVRLAELYPGARVWTLDRDFHVYRRSNRQVISLVSPW